MDIYHNSQTSECAFIAKVEGGAYLIYVYPENSETKGELRVIPHNFNFYDSEFKDWDLVQADDLEQRRANLLDIIDAIGTGLKPGILSLIKIKDDTVVKKLNDQFNPITDDISDVEEVTSDTE